MIPSKNLAVHHFPSFTVGIPVSNVLIPRKIKLFSQVAAAYHLGLVQAVFLRTGPDRPNGKGGVEGGKVAAPLPFHWEKHHFL